MAKGILQQRDFIVDYIRRNQCVSRLHIAREFDMHPSTVGNIVEVLLSSGLVMETPGRLRSTGAGRPPRLLRLNPDAGCFIGLDVYRRRITAVLTDFSGSPRLETTLPLPHSPRRKTALGLMEEAVRRLIGSGDRAAGLRGIGTGLPGLVDRQAGVGVSYRPIRDWRDVPVRRRLEDSFGVPVFVEHNSNTMALGEACFGAASDYDHVVAVLLRTGISIGEVRHREIHRFASTGAGELGHTIIDARGPICWCGARGCLEAHVSGWALRKRLRRYLHTHPDWPGRAAFTSVGEFDPAILCRLAAGGEPRAEAILRPAFRALGIGIHTVTRLLAPDAIVISGPFHAAATLMREEIAAVLRRPGAHPPRLPEIIVSGEGDRIGAVGAALLAASRFCNPIHRMPH